MNRRRDRDRVSRPSLPGDERSPFTTLGIGCGIGCLALLLVAGALGIAVGAGRRLASFSGDDDPPRIDEPRETTDPAEPDPAITPPPSAADPLASMQARYRPGPHARIESMVPSGRLLPAVVPGQPLAGRTIDNPWIVPGSELRPTPPPAPRTDGPRVEHAPNEPYAQPLTVVARTPARVQVRARDAAGGTDVVAYVVEFVGYQGHFHLPATVPTELGSIQASGSDGATVHFAIASPQRPGGAPLAAGETFPVTMRVAALDSQGRMSGFLTRELSVVAVGAGDVEVTLTMGEPTDLDLYVTDPTNTTVYYGNTQAASGGHLDLDANAACGSNMGVNNEHIYWPAGRAPSGTYRVNVAHYASCIDGRPVAYRVTIRACGETVVLTGNFGGASRAEQCFEVDPPDPNVCQRVVTFDVPPCAS